MRPVFFDRSGRRRRLAVVVGSGLATALLIALGLLVAGLSGASPAGVPGFPDRDGDAGGAAADPPTTPPRTSPPPSRSTGAGLTPSPSAPATSTPAPTRQHGNPHSPTRTPPHPKPTKSG
jgi:hypothetical protein